MSGFDLHLDPIGELVLQHCGANVGDPSLRRLGQLDVRFWEI